MLPTTRQTLFDTDSQPLGYMINASPSDCVLTLIAESLTALDKHTTVLIQARLADLNEIAIAALADRQVIVWLQPDLYEMSKLSAMLIALAENRVSTALSVDLAGAQNVMPRYWITDIPADVPDLKPFHGKLIVTHIDTPEQYAACASQPLAMWTGAYRNEAAALSSPLLSPRVGTLLKIIDLLQSDPPISVLESYVRVDPNLVARLFLLLNAAARHSHKQVETLHDAIIYIGYGALARWCSLLLVLECKGNISEETQMKAVVRALFMETLAGKTSAINPNHAFIVAIYSLLGELFGEFDTEGSDIPQQFRDALAEGSQMPLALLLRLVQCAEREKPFVAFHEMLSALQLDMQTYNRAHLNAVSWAKAYLD